MTELVITACMLVCLVCMTALLVAFTVYAIVELGSE